MNWITFFLGYLMSIQVNCACVEKIYFLENNIWEKDQVYVETEKGFLNAFYLRLLKEPTCEFTFLTMPSNCLYFKFLNHAYTFLSKNDNDLINSFIKSEDLKNVFFNIVLYFHEHPLEKEELFDDYTGRKRLFSTYEPLRKTLGKDKSILECEKIQIRLLHIKERLSVFSSKETVFMKDMGDTEIKIMLKDFGQYAMFGFHYFKGYTDCLIGVKDFLNTLCFFEIS